MKLLSAILLLLSSSDLTVAAVGSGIRGTEVSEQEEPKQSQETRDLELFRSTETKDYELLSSTETKDYDLLRSPETFDVEPMISTKTLDDAPVKSGAEVKEKPILLDDVDPLEDVKIAAASMGLTLSEAQKLLQQQEHFAALVDKMQEDDNFNQAEMPSKPNGEFIIMYKGDDIPAESEKVIEKFMGTKEINMGATVKRVATKLSLKDAQARGQRFSETLEKQRYLEVSFSIDGDDIELMAKKSRDHDPKEDCGPVIPKQRAAEILRSSDMDGVTLILIDFDMDVDTVEPLHTYGGRKISGGGYQCTTAFSVITGSGTTGISTAAHCTGMNNYDAVFPEADYATYFQGQHRGTYGDVEWHTTPHWEPAEYYARPNQRRPVTSVANSISKGQWVCGYSRMQGTRKCDKVYKTSVSVKYSGLPRMYNLVAMNGRMMIGGDSGGPWSYGNRAFGVVSGGKVICNFLFFGCRWRDIWSRASYLSPALGVMVRTQ